MQNKFNGLSKRCYKGSVLLEVRKPSITKGNPAKYKYHGSNRDGQIHYLGADSI